MATPRRWSIRDAGIAHFFDLSTDSLVVSLPTLKTNGVEFTGETVYSRGGKGNPKIIGFSSNREGKVTLQDAIFDNIAFAMLTGNDAEIGAKVIDFDEFNNVTSSTINLGKLPVGAITNVFILNADGTNGTELTLGTPVSNADEYSISGKDITVHNSIINDAEVRIYYKVTTGNDATTIKVTSDKFGKSFRVVLDCEVVDEFTKNTYQAQLRIPTAKFEDNFSFNLAAEGDPAVLDLNMEILKPSGSTTMFEMVVYDQADIIAA